MNDQERIATLLGQGLSGVAISAILNVPLAIIEDLARGGGSSLPTGIGIPDVQTALDTGTLVVPGGSSGPVAHDYVSDGDTNGIFYALGTLGGGSFVNPAPDSGSGPVLPAESSILTPWNPPPHASYLTDRDSSVNIFHTAGPAVGWVLWDFIGRKVKVREYTVRSRWDANSTHPTAWQLQGSNDNATWDVLDEGAPGFTTVDQWRHFTCDSVPADPYRYVRLIDYADSYLVLGEVELYGDLYTS